MASSKKSLYKLTFFVILLFVAFIGLFYLFISSYSLSMEKAQKEIEGIKYIKTMQSLVYDMQRTRGLFMLDKNEFNANLKTVVRDIKKIKTMPFCDDICGGAFDVFLKLEEPLSVTEAKEVEFNDFTKSIDYLQKKLLVIEAEYGLVLDSDWDTYFLTIVMTNYLPNLIESLAKERGVTTGVLNSTCEIKDHMVTIEESRFSFFNFMRTVDFIGKNIINNRYGEVFSELDRLKNEYKELNTIFDSLKEQKKPNLDAYVFFNSASGLVGKYHVVYLKIADLIEKRLVSRLSKIKSTIFLGAFITLIAIVALLILFFFMIKNLSKAIDDEKNIKESLVKINKLKTELLNSKNIHEICSKSLGFLVKELDAKQGLVYVYEKTNGKFILARNFGADDGVAQYKLDFDDNLIAQAAVEQRDILSCENDKELLTVPLFDKKELIAVMQFVFAGEVKKIDISKYNEIVVNFIHVAKIKEENTKYIGLIDNEIMTFSTNEFGYIHRVSEAICAISGYKKEELIGKKQDILIHPDMQDELVKEIKESVKCGKTWTGEIKNIKKNGDIYWVDATVKQRVDSFGNTLGCLAIYHDITDKKRIEEISVTDGLTNVYNRGYFEKIFPLVINGAKRDAKIVVFLMIDIDHFKEYNDSYGHQEGDEALKKVAISLKENMKRAGDYVFRLGGEEFGILFHAKDTEDAKKQALKIKDAICALKIPHKKNGDLGYLSISAGYEIILPTCILSTNDIYKAVDNSLYKAKTNGRNRVETLGLIKVE